MLDWTYTKSLDCVHCGLCLTACPTYLETGRETSSPRGRVYLMRGAAEGHIPLEGLLAEEAYLCLGCRACETACPSGVEYGAMLEHTRAEIEKAGARTGLAASLEHYVLSNVLPRPKRLHRLVSLLGWLQRTRLDRLGIAVLSHIPGLSRWGRALAERHQLMPAIPAAPERAAPPERTRAEGERRGTVALFTGCVMPELFGAVHLASIRVLAANGFDVVAPLEQGCCGALLAHSGKLDSARDLARHNAEVFAGMEIDAIVVNSAGCGAAMREAPVWIGAAGRPYAAKVRDICEFLDEVGLRAPTERIDARVCYDDPCHLLHGQGVGDAPRRLLSAIPGLELVEHANPGACCGAAGIYNLTHSEMSQQVLARKLDALESAGPDLIATGNPGCLMQLRAGAEGRRMAARVVHPVEILDRAYGSGSPS